MQQEPQGPRPKSRTQGYGEMLEVLAVGARCLAMCVEPVLNSAPGGERYSAFGLVAFFGMFAISAQAHDSAVFRYAWFWFAMVLYRRIEVFIRWRSGRRVHSRSPGYAWLADRTGMAKLGWLANPMLCLAIGGSLMLVSEALGKLWLASGVAIVFIEGVNAMLRQLRIQTMFDQGEEMEWAAKEAKDYR